MNGLLRSQNKLCGQVSGAVLPEGVVNYLGAVDLLDLHQ